MCSSTCSLATRRKLNNGSFFALECGEFVNFSLHCLWTNEFFPSLSSGVLPLIYNGLIEQQEQYLRQLEVFLSEALAEAST